MKIRNLVVTCLLACLTSGVAGAQTRTPGRDAGFTVGVNVPMYKGVESDATVGFTYGQFYYNGLGFRAGFQYTPSVAEVDNAFGVPVAFAYRTGTRSRRARLESGLSSAANSVFWDVYNDYDTGESAMDMFTAFLASLFSNIEFTAGITPGYISGDDSSVSTGSTVVKGGEIWNKTWTERNNQFSMTVDAGACLNYGIWRFDIKLMPAFHYCLTDNYIRHYSNGDSVNGMLSSSTQPVRWFFSFAGGLTFRF